MSSVTAGTGTMSGAAPIAQPRKRAVGSRGGKRGNPIVAFLWGWYIWIAGTFSLGMLEVWEQLLVAFITISLSCLIWWSVYFHFPDFVRTVIERGSYYIFGTSSSNAHINSMGVTNHTEL